MTTIVVDDLHAVPDPEARLSQAAALAHAQNGSDAHKLIVRVPDRATNGVRVFRAQDVARLLQPHGRVLELGVTEGGTIVGAVELCRKRGPVAIWTGQAIGPWAPSDIVQRGLGGSETAAVRLAQELAAMGYVVTLYGHFEAGVTGIADDVLLRHFDEFDPTEELDALVGFRNATLFDHRPNARFCALWLEDLAPAEALTPPRAENVDRVCCVSRWHVAQVLDAHPWLEEAKLAACRNGIVPSFFERDDPPERAPRVVYSSSPDRGGDIMLEIWPKVRERVPDAELLLTYARWFDLVATVFPSADELKRHIYELLEQPGVSRVEGGLGQRDLAHLLLASKVWAHPSWYTPGTNPDGKPGGTEFHETSCISAMEAQMAGCVVVGSNWGALQETVQHGTLIDGDPREVDGSWRQAFVDAIVEGLTDGDVQAAAQTVGPEMVRDLDWRGAAEQLASMFPVRTAAVGPTHMLAGAKVGR